MNKIFITIAVLCISFASNAQSFAVFSGDKKLTGNNIELVDSIVFYTDNQGVTPPHESISKSNQRSLVCSWHFNHMV